MTEATQSPLLAIRWTASAIGARQLLSLLTLALLARLLEPGDFGLVAMAVVMVGFATMFRDLGAAQSIVQREDLTERYTSGQFYAVLAISAVITLLAVASAPFVASLFQEPQLEPVILALSPVFIVSAVGSVPQALLERRLAFRSVAIAEIVAASVASVVAVVVAVSGGGVWSLVAQALVTSAVASAAYLVAARWRPRLMFGWPETRSATRFGAALTVSNLTGYVNRNADNLLIGRALGTTQLGFYSAAYRIMSIPSQLVAVAFGRVLYPLISRSHDDRVQARSLYLRTVAGIAFVALPLGATIAVTSHRIVPVVLGPGWEPTVPVLQILAIVAMAQAIGSTTGPVWMATGKVREWALYGVVSSIVVVAGFAVGLQWGIVGVAASYFVTAVLILWLPSLWLSLRHIGLSLSSVYVVTWRSAACSLVAVLAVAIVDAIAGERPDILVLSLDVIAGLAVYLMVSIRINPVLMASLLTFAGGRNRVVISLRRRLLPSEDESNR